MAERCQWCFMEMGTNEKCQCCYYWREKFVVTDNKIVIFGETVMTFPPEKPESINGPKFQIGSNKYHENEIVSDLIEYLNQTYSEHYKPKTASIECFDAWLALGDAGPTFRNTAMKYLWRCGKKEGETGKKDLMKAMHYILMALYAEYYHD
jgi:hypothetical protein